MSSPRRRRLTATVTAVLALGLSLSACSDVSLGGGSGPEPVASVPALSGKTTKIALDGGFVDALGALGLAPGVTGNAKLRNGKLIFPITGGNVTVFPPGTVSPYVIGQLQHTSSGLTLSAGATTVRLSRFNVDPGASRVYGDVAVNGRTAVRDAYLFALDGRTLEPIEASGNKAVLQGTRVEISPVAAKLLNDTFGTDQVSGGLLVGIATITVRVSDQ